MEVGVPMENDVLESSQTNEIMVCVGDCDGIREEVVVNLSSLVVEENQTQEKQNFQLQPIVTR